MLTPERIENLKQRMEPGQRPGWKELILILEALRETFEAPISDLLYDLKEDIKNNLLK